MALYILYLISSMKVAEALEKVGNSHRYQYFTLVFLCLVWFQIVYTMLGPSYIYMNPTFKCDSTGDRILEEEEACPMIATCRLGKPEITCSGYLLDHCRSGSLLRQASRTRLGAINNVCWQHPRADHYESCERSLWKEVCFRHRIGILHCWMEL